MRPNLAREYAPNGPDWLHEIKIDGYRAQLHVHDGHISSAATVKPMTILVSELCPLRQ